MSTRMRTVLGGIAALAVLSLVAGAAYVAGTKRAEPPQTRLSLATCGLAPSPEPLDLPLAVLLDKAAAPGLALGPIVHAGLDAPLTVHFRALAPGEAPFARMGADGLRLGLDRARLPDEIRLGCRYGTIARVEHRRGPLRLRLEVEAEGEAGVAGEQLAGDGRG